MAETLEKPETIEYTPEELSQIRELTQFFDLAPGQIAGAKTPDDSVFSDGPVDDTPLNIEDHSQPVDVVGLDDLGESPETTVPSTEKSSFADKAPPKRSNLSDLDDLLNADLDNLESLDGSEKEESKQSEEPATPPDESPDFTADTDFQPEALTSSGEPEGPSLDDFNLPGDDKPQDLDFGNVQDSPADMPSTGDELSSGSFTDFAPPADEPENLTSNFPESAEAIEPLDFPAEDSGQPEAGDEFALPSDSFDLADSTQSPDQLPQLDDLGAVESTEGDFSGGMDFDLPVDSESEMSPSDGDAPDSGNSFDTLEFPSDSPETLSFDDTSTNVPADSATLPPDFGVADSMDFGSSDMSFSDSPQTDFPGAPSLHDLSPEIAVNRGSLDSELSTLANENSGPQIDPEEMRRLRTRLKEYPGDVRRLISASLLEDKFSDLQAADFVQMVLAGAGPEEVRNFLTQNVGATSPIEIDAAGPAQVIVSRPEYTEEGLERQARLIRLSRIGSLAAVVLIGLVGGLYFSILKPLLYRQEIAKGREIILGKGDTGEAISQAEKHFQKAIKYYPDDSKAYLQFADAYRRKGLYDNAFKKLFADVELENTGKAIRYEEKEISNSGQFWNGLKKVPIVTYAGSDRGKLKINGLTFQMRKAGAYVVTHLENDSPSAAVLAALGEFHANPARRFRKSLYANNHLGLDYYRRILTFKTDMPVFGSESTIQRAILGIGNIYYDQKDYNRALDYFEKVLAKDPESVAAHAGAIRALIRISKNTGDPRLVLQHHSLIKHKLKMEEKLPLYIKAALAAFYIDLPSQDNLRIRYNISPVDSVTGKEIKTRARELLDSIFTSKEEDTFGNVREGKNFAEGYYQRGRYFAKDEKQVRMALKQYEYAYNFDRSHFMALNDRAELLIDLKDYAGAMELLKLALPEIEPEKMDLLGDDEAHETLADADTGIIPFNMGRAMYLSVVRDLVESESWLRIDEVKKFNNGSERGIDGLSAQLDRIEGFFNMARERGLKNEKASNALSFYEGWVSFVRGNYRKALQSWSSIPTENMHQFSGLDLAKSHCYYKLAVDDHAERKKHLETALGLLQYSRGKFQKPADKISEPVPGNKQHIKIFSRLAIVENNMGAVYELMGDEANSLQHYWRSVDYGKKAGRENEVAQVNIKLNFRRNGLENEEATPLIMDYISPYAMEEAGG